MSLSVPEGRLLVQDRVNAGGPEGVLRSELRQMVIDAGVPEKQSIHCLHRSRRTQPHLWVNAADYLRPLPAGGDDPPAGFPPSMARSRSLGNDDPSATVAGPPIPALEAVEDRLRECVVSLGVSEKDAKVLSYFMRPYMADRETFEFGLGAYPQMMPPVKKMISLTWAAENWPTVGSGLHHGGVPEVQPREKWVAFNGEIMKADPGDPGAVDLSAAVAQAQLQQGKTSMVQAQAPVTAPDSMGGLAQLAETIGVPLVDVLRGILGGGDSNAVPADSDALVRMEEIAESKARREMVQVSSAICRACSRTSLRSSARARVVSFAGQYSDVASQRPSRSPKRRRILWLVPGVPS